MKVIDHRKLPEERLATNADDGSRVYIFPAAVKGFFRTARNYTQLILVLFFLVLPWIKINGHQALLLHISDRRFAIFGLTFWAHDTPMLFFVLLFLVMTLGFVTAIWGRIWCGWACPQTVFIDGVFRRIDQFIIGTHLDQIQFAKAKWTVKKILKWLTKWSLYTGAGLIISHSFIAYFVGVEDLRQIVLRPPSENYVTFLVMVFITAFIVFDFGWFREQFCIIMCPYGRLQSVLMGKNSLAVLYDEKRGEPRGKLQNSTNPSTTPKGDCIDCFKCVSVCPTGIDIRRGVQMECIACTACIDVCNEVMTKINKPKNLIRYDSVAQMEGLKRHLITPRVGVYFATMVICVLGLTWSISNRKPVDISILRGHDSPYSYENEAEHSGRILNHFKLHIKNQEFSDMKVSYEIEGPVELISPVNPVVVRPGELMRVPFFVRFPQEVATNGQLKVLLKFTASYEDTTRVLENPLNLAAPIVTIKPHSDNDKDSERDDRSSQPHAGE